MKYRHYNYRFPKSVDPNIYVSAGAMASLDVDAQQGFTPLCLDELPVPGGHDIAKELNRQAKLVRLRTASKDAHCPNALWRATKEYPQLTPITGKNIDVRWNMHCVPGTKGFELIPGLPPVIRYKYVAYKGMEPDMHPYGACYHDLAGTISTGLIEYYECNGIRVVIVGGLATEYCVKVTVLQLIQASFGVVVNLGACRGFDPEPAIKEMKEAGALIVGSAAELVEKYVFS
jgi:nicotinamidase/pyrazinamidase